MSGLSQPSMLSMVLSGAAPSMRGNAAAARGAMIRTHSADEDDLSLSGLDDAILAAIRSAGRAIDSDQLYAQCRELCEERADLARSIAKLVRLEHIASVDSPLTPARMRRYWLTDGTEPSETPAPHTAAAGVRASPTHETPPAPARRAPAAAPQQPPEDCPNAATVVPASPAAPNAASPATDEDDDAHDDETAAATAEPQQQTAAAPQRRVLASTPKVVTASDLARYQGTARPGTPVEDPADLSAANGATAAPTGGGAESAAETPTADGDGTAAESRPEAGGGAAGDGLATSPTQIAAAVAAVYDFDEPEEPTGPTLGCGSDDRMIPIDLPTLLRTRMLITATSGGGKSWALRRILEQSANHVQQIIIDPEGEFLSLADKYPHIICSTRPDAAIVLTIGSAKALARQLVKARTSAILDTSEFEPEERHLFVANFVSGLMQAEQADWHHLIVAIDEAHLFAPQHDKSEAKKHMIDLTSRGRKRGFCPIFATTRLSKLNKSAAAELQNRMIGRTSLDVDVRRAADELGMAITEASRKLPDLNPGEFYVYGPALTPRVAYVKVGTVETKHGAFVSSEIEPPTTATPETIQAIAAAIAPPKKKGETDKMAVARPEAQQNTGEDRRTVVARMRLSWIEPIRALPGGSPERRALFHLASQAMGVTEASLYAWLAAYDPSDPLGSVMPKKVFGDVSQMRGYEPATSQEEEQGTAATGTEAEAPAAPASAEAASSPISVPVPLGHAAAGDLRRIPLTAVQRMKLGNAGIGPRHMDVLEFVRANPAASHAGIGTALAMAESDVKAHLTLASLVLGLPTPMQLAHAVNCGAFADGPGEVAKAPEMIQ